MQEKRVIKKLLPFGVFLPEDQYLHRKIGPVSVANMANYWEGPSSGHHMHDAGASDCVAFAGSFSYVLSKLYP